MTCVQEEKTWIRNVTWQELIAYSIVTCLDLLSVLGKSGLAYRDFHNPRAIMLHCLREPL